LNVVIKYTGLSPYENSQKYLFRPTFTTKKPENKHVFGIFCFVAFGKTCLYQIEVPRHWRGTSDSIYNDGMCRIIRQMEAAKAK